MALTTLESLNAEIKELEAKKRLVEKRDGEVPKAMAVLEKYASVLSPTQRQQIAKLIGAAINGTSTRGSGTGGTSSKGRKLGKVAPKYRLPTGEVWTGRGLAPTAFAAWLKSAEGRQWAKANPGVKFPPIDGAVSKATADTVNRATKSASKSVPKGKRPPAKGATKPAKRAIRNTTA